MAQGSEAATSSLVTSDYPNVGSAAWSSSVTPTTTAAYTTFALNSTGIAGLNKGGWTKIAALEQNDLDNSAPTDTSSTGFEVWASEQTGTTQDPFLQVNYTIPGAAATSSFAARFDNGDFRNYTYSIIDASSSQWVMQDKYGTTYTFGSATSSRLDNPSDSSQVYRWMLTKVQDTNGNYIKYNYNKDDGQVYPSSVVYAGNGTTDGPFQVDFLKTSRSDIATSSKTAFNVVDNYLINEIDSTVNGTWVHKYALGYGTGSNGKRSLLTSITESGQQEDGSVSLSLPAQTLAYTASTSGWTTASWNMPGDGSNTYLVNNGADNGTRLLDINGDALPDFVYYKDDGGTKPHGSCWGHTASNGWDHPTCSTVTFPAPIITSSPYVENGVRWADINGDGINDFLQDTHVLFGHGSYWDSSASSTWELPVATNNGSGGDNGTRFVDLNGDGLVDIVANNTDVWFNTGKGWNHASTSWNLPIAIVNGSNLDAGARFADLNGDGLMDVVNNTTAWMNTGSGWVRDDAFDPPQPFIGSSNEDEGSRMLDVNGDGLADEVRYNYNSTDGTTTVAYINNGHGYTHTTRGNLQLKSQPQIRAPISVCASRTSMPMACPISFSTATRHQAFI
jgi:hypothetical protein